MSTIGLYMSKYDFSKRNSEGYLDLTAYCAIVNVDGKDFYMDENIMDNQIDNKIEEKFEKDDNTSQGTNKRKYDHRTVVFYRLLKVIFEICSMNGFHVEGHIKLRDMKTGKIWY